MFELKPVKIDYYSFIITVKLNKWAKITVDMSINTMLIKRQNVLLHNFLLVW